MDERAYPHWLELHRRIVMGETLNATEQAAYEAGCRELRAQIAEEVERVQALTVEDLRYKDIFQLFASAAEELGELSRELLIEEGIFGNIYKRKERADEDIRAKK